MRSYCTLPRDRPHLFFQILYSKAFFGCSCYLTKCQCAANTPGLTVRVLPPNSRNYRKFVEVAYHFHWVFTADVPLRCHRRVTPPQEVLSLFFK